MNPKPNVRNVARIRRVLLESLYEEWVDLWIQDQEPSVLHTVLRGRTYQQWVAKRLHIRLPENSQLVGLIVSKAYIRSVRARKELNRS